MSSAGILKAQSSSLESATLPSRSVFDISQAQAQDSVQWLLSAAARHLPQSYSGDKDWGDTKKVWAGVRMKLDGVKLKTHRRYRELKHGRWVRYEIRPPKSQTQDRWFTPIVESVTREPAKHWRITTFVVAPMEFTAQVQRWNLGAKLYSVTVTGRMQVSLDLTATIGFYADLGEVPPAIVADPKIVAAKVELLRFEVDRVSNIGGDAAEAWGEIMQEVVVERFVKKQNDKIVAKLNSSIENNREELRLSVSELFRFE